MHTPYVFVWGSGEFGRSCERILHRQHEKEARAGRCRRGKNTDPHERNGVVHSRRSTAKFESPTKLIQLLTEGRIGLQPVVHGLTCMDDRTVVAAAEVQTDRLQ